VGEVVSAIGCGSECQWVRVASASGRWQRVPEGEGSAHQKVMAVGDGSECYAVSEGTPKPTFDQLTIPSPLASRSRQRSDRMS
jgi:hypothetical protein